MNPLLHENMNLQYIHVIMEIAMGGGVMWRFFFNFALGIEDFLALMHPHAGRMT